MASSSEWATVMGAAHAHQTWAVSTTEAVEVVNHELVEEMSGVRARTVDRDPSSQQDDALDGLRHRLHVATKPMAVHASVKKISASALRPTPNDCALAAVRARAVAGCQ